MSVSPPPLPSSQTHDGSSISSSYIDYVKHELTRVNTVAGEFNQDVYNTQFVEFTNATCGCWGYNTNSTSSTTWGEVVSPNSVPSILLPWTGTIDPITTEAELNARVCSQVRAGVCAALRSKSYAGLACLPVGVARLLWPAQPHSWGALAWASGHTIRWHR